MDLHRLHVGCGASPLPGWINLDNSPVAKWPWLFEHSPTASSHQRYFAKVVRLNGIRFGAAMRLTFPTGSTEIIYSSHMLEHLDRREAEAFLREALRVLTPGGYLRLVVPDIRRHVEDYLEAGDADAFVGRMLMAAPRPRTIPQRITAALVGHRNHLWMYDGTSLAKLLSSVGFADITVQPAGSSMLPECGLNLRERDEESVYVEARKP